MIIRLLIPPCVILLFALILSGCMQPILYESSQLSNFDARPENIRLEFVTEKGHQVAFYFPPLNAPQRPPARLNILYPGINSLALNWYPFLNREEDPDAAYLLIDYPGRGLSEGYMRPEDNLRSTEGALKALSNKFGETELDAELNLLGHSFGTGAALQFAERSKVSRIVLVAPFNTLRAAVAVRSWFLSIIMPDQIDNRKIIRKILQEKDSPRIAIFHGRLDATLPVAMGRELAAIDPAKIDYFEFANDDHTSVLTTRRNLIFSLLNGRSEKVAATPQVSGLKNQN